MVPSFAADGVGKMKNGGMMSKMMPSGGKAMKNSAMPKKTKG
jgi:hypothetical protein